MEIGKYYLIELGSYQQIVKVLEHPYENVSGYFAEDTGMISGQKKNYLYLERLYMKKNGVWGYEHCIFLTDKHNITSLYEVVSGADVSLPDGFRIVS